MSQYRKTIKGEWQEEDHGLSHSLLLPVIFRSSGIVTISLSAHNLVLLLSSKIMHQDKLQIISERTSSDVRNGTREVPSWSMCAERLEGCSPSSATAAVDQVGETCFRDIFARNHDGLRIYSAKITVEILDDLKS